MMIIVVRIEEKLQWVSTGYLPHNVSLSSMNESRQWVFVLTPQVAKYSRVNLDTTNMCAPSLCRLSLICPCLYICPSDNTWHAWLQINPLTSPKSQPGAVAAVYLWGWACTEVWYNSISFVCANMIYTVTVAWWQILLKLDSEMLYKENDIII